MHTKKKNIQKVVTKKQKFSLKRLEYISRFQKDLYALLDSIGGDKTRVAKLKNVLNIHFRNLRTSVYYDEQTSIKILKILDETEKTLLELRKHNE